MCLTLEPELLTIMWGILSLEERAGCWLESTFTTVSISPLAVAQADSVQGKPPGMGKEEGEVKPRSGWARSPFCCQHYMLCAILLFSRSKNAGQIPGLQVQLQMISFVDIFAFSIRKVIFGSSYGVPRTFPYGNCVSVPDVLSLSLK